MNSILSACTRSVRSSLRPSLLRPLLSSNSQIRLMNDGERISRFPVPEVSSLPEDIQARFREEEEKTRYPLSCNDLEPDATSGVYEIQPSGACRPLRVYCEKAGSLVDRRAFTFLPRSLTRRQDAQQIIDALFTDRKNVLLKLQKKNDRSEAYTLIQPHNRYTSVSFGIMVNAYTNYTRLQHYSMKDYIFLGILPSTIANKKSTQGFKSNGKTVEFTNCDANPNSYFAFLPNHDQQTPLYDSNRHYEHHGVAVEWRATAKGITNPDRMMPNEFFFFTELHFGGCGTYTSSDRWSKFGYHATAIGIR